MKLNVHGIGAWERKGEKKIKAWNDKATVC